MHIDRSKITDELPSISIVTRRERLGAQVSRVAGSMRRVRASTAATATSCISSGHRGTCASVWVSALPTKPRAAAAAAAVAAAAAGVTVCATFSLTQPLARPRKMRPSRARSFACARACRRRLVLCLPCKVGRGGSGQDARARCCVCASAMRATGHAGHF